MTQVSLIKHGGLCLGCLQTRLPPKFFRFISFFLQCVRSVLTLLWTASICCHVRHLLHQTSTHPQVKSYKKKEFPYNPREKFYPNMNKINIAILTIYHYLSNKYWRKSCVNYYFRYESLFNSQSRCQQPCSHVFTY